MRKKLLVSLLFSALPLILFFLAVPARAGTIINVNSTSDAIANEGRCTLREAIIAANTDTASGLMANECPAGSGVDTINVPAGTYNLSLGGSLNITQSVAILGHLPSDTIIIQTDTARVFNIPGAINVTLSNLSISDGYDLSGFGGGGIYNTGALTLTNVTLASNYSSSSGGGLLNQSGAIASLTQVYFTLNSAGNNGGAIANHGTLTMTRGHLIFQFARNGANVYNSSSATIYSSILEAGTAQVSGGGVDNNYGTLIAQNSTINSNIAYGTGGGIYNDLYATLTNVTLSGNQAISATVGWGGGIWNTGFVTLTHGTIVSNSASLSGGGIFQDSGAIGFVMRNSILAYQAFGGGNCALGGGITSQGYNLDDGFSCFLSGTGDQAGADPLLGPLNDNGGYVYTHAHSTASPAFDQIPYGTNGCGTAVKTDARGFTRLAPCDLGAFEYVLRVMLPLISR